MSDKVYAIVGDACWICGYDKDRRILDFHHVDPSKKEMFLSIREISSASWTRIAKELVKCMSICCRCHREIEYGLIPHHDVMEIYKSKWDAINTNPAISFIGEAQNS